MQRIAIPALLLLLAGCAGEPDVYGVVQDRTYTPSEFRFAAEHKDFPTAIAGDAFGAPRRVVWDTILSAMQTENWWNGQIFNPRSHFTDTPATKDSPYLVTVLLNPPDKVSPSTYCQVQDHPLAKSAPSKSGTVSVRMAFCKSGVLLSTSRGWVENVTSPDDPRFRKMITRMTMELFPQRVDRYDDKCGPFNMRRSC